MRFSRQCALAAALVLCVSAAPGAAAVDSDAPASPLCHVRLSYPKSALQEPQRTAASTGAAKAFAAHFPAIVADLRARRYDRAARTMALWYGYVDGRSATVFASEDALLFAGRFHDAFVAAYQGEFCTDSGYIDVQALGAGDGSLFARALKQAIAGRYPAAARAAAGSADYDRNFSTGLILAGWADVARGDLRDARTVWVRALEIKGFPYPEQILPADDRVAAAEYLLHYRP